MENEVIICFGYSSWDFWRQDHEIMLELAKKNKVIYVEKQSGFSAFRIKNKNIWKAIISNPIAINDNLFMFPSIPRLPIALPGIMFWVFRKIRNRFVPKSILWSKKLLKFYVKMSLRKLNLKPTVVWCFEPFELPLMGHFGERISCYRVFDEVSLFEGWLPFREIVENFEKKYITKANFVFASSRFQYEKRKRLNPNTFLIPNACNFERYHKVLTEILPIPPDVKNIRRPIIGFMGTINYNIDTELIGLLSTAHPEWSIVLVGPQIQTTVDAIFGKSGNNVFLLGYKNVNELPCYIKCFDVCLIPYVIDEQRGKTFYPWKMHEYLAAGKPVVTTDIPEIRQFGNVVRFAKTKKEFLSCVEEELRTDTKEKIKLRVKIASENTWENRIREIDQIIERKEIDD